MASRRWMFTLFEDFPSPPFADLPESAEYLICQKEKAPTTGKIHLQGFIVLKSPRRITFLRKFLGKSAHLEHARSKSSSCRDYCRKDATRTDGPWEYGVFAEQGSKARKAMERYRSDPDELRLSDPQLYRRCLAESINSQFGALVLPLFTRPWQICFNERINQGPDDRNIIWVCGTQGGEGKTTRAKGLVKDGWFYSRGGKSVDIKYSYSMHMGHVCFDLPRQSEEILNYAVIEEIKDRLIRSAKYEPLDINAVDRVHVVVFANFKPLLEDVYDSRGIVSKRQAMSKDRVVVFDLDEGCVRHNDEIIQQF
uniref:Replication-associated protein n=1 Tax=Sorghum mastrevirus associated alphasatellite TaxID=2846239 RepID=A0A6M8WDQ8_9VIRU|nr:replication-associated protein [Sorghum mastrevirus associated alphasatellite]QKK13645.1 replication-associated protein [Sorghum mastrevirus associated alphasatellite]QKK13647.1 replication-associated protein [Sorghum mastrevirus associated alphasatellite]